MTLEDQKSSLLLRFSPDRVVVDPDLILEYGKDRTIVHTPAPLAVVFPRSLNEIREVVRYCYENNLSMVPSGGRTGYAGAAVAANHEVVISLSKMDRINAMDVESGSVQVEAGAILEDVQRMVSEEGLYFPLDFAARGSAQIGGCISTNAGGLKVLKYGMTRELVLGLEVVVANGEMLDLNSNLHKNNSGYDLKQFFIGAEGTLGIIARATMKIVPRPRQLQVALLAVSDFEPIMTILRRIRLEGVDVTAFEFFSAACLDAVLAHRSLRRPFAGDYPFYVVVEIDEGGKQNQLVQLLEWLAVDGLIVDGTVATSSASFTEIWAYREDISESISMLGSVHKNDVAVPVSSMPSFLGDLRNLISSRYQNFDVLLFGHIGDGNIHVNVIDRSHMKPDSFRATTADLDIAMCELIRQYHGSVSAEHGIGLLKKKLLHLQRSDAEIQMMKNIKRSIDPKNLFNPGKIIDM